MRHKVAGKHLGRDTDHRKNLRRNLLNSLFQHERITTTQAKAQAIRAEAEKLITIAKRGRAHSDPARGVHARRLLLARRYETRPGGYLRLLKLGPRKGDAAPMVMIELVDREEG